MLMQFNSTQPVHVDVVMDFVDGAQYRFAARLDKRGPLNHVVVGRWAKDLTCLALEYDGRKFLYPFQPMPDGINLKPINIYSSRDKWAEMLRQKAMEIS